MPMSKNLKSGKKQPLNLSLFSDYKPETTLKGLGFKDKNKAIYTLDAIKGRDTKYQVNVVSTMLGRAKNHPNKTPDMDDAILVFEKWMLDYKKSKHIANWLYFMIKNLINKNLNILKLKINLNLMIIIIWGVHFIFLYFGDVDNLDISS